MTLQTLQQLDYDGLLEAVKTAIFVTTREEGKFMVFLYRLDDSFIELYYHKKYSYIYGFKTFDDKDRLQPFLRIRK